MFVQLHYQKPPATFLTPKSLETVVSLCQCVLVCLSVQQDLNSSRRCVSLCLHLCDCPIYPEYTGRHGQTAASSWSHCGGKTEITMVCLQNKSMKRDWIKKHFSILWTVLRLLSLTLIFSVWFLYTSISLYLLI